MHLSDSPSDSQTFLYSLDNDEFTVPCDYPFVAANVNEDKTQILAGREALSPAASSDHAVEADGNKNTLLSDEVQEWEVPVPTLRSRLLVEQDQRERRRTTPLTEGDQRQQGLPVILDEDDDGPPRRRSTWYKEIEYSTPRRTLSYPPRPSKPTPVSLRRVPPPPPRLFFWVGLLVVVALVLSGAFGIINTLGRGQSNAGNNIALQVTPTSGVGGTKITLHGNNFSAHGRIGLSRDGSIPIVNTAGSVITTADAQGNFTDTVVIGDDWGNGMHNINAEDATTHTIASFPILVTQSTPLRPGHLHISQDSLDLGSGDALTGSARTITLSNTGSGQISWQAKSEQPWLQITPKSGIAIHGVDTQITIAVNRVNLSAGSYNSRVVFTSDVGDAPLVVQMQVTPLAQEHEPAIQLTPSVLSFSGTDGGPVPQSQTITISNPGALPLQWAAATDAPWLSITPRSAKLEQNGSSQVTIAVNTASLLPGTYQGVITFSGQGASPVRNSPQNLYISVTITPRCSLQLSPVMLTFAGTYQQSAPAARSINLAGITGCSTPIQWKATSNADWLTLGSTDGTTPSRLSVGVKVDGLKPGTYNGKIMFSSTAGTQTLPVTFTLSQPSAPSMQVMPDSVQFNAVIGSSVSTPQQLTIKNSGGGALHWNAAATTAAGGNWLSVTPASGVLSAGQSTTITVAATLINTLTPGVYTGMVTITGKDDAGKDAGGSSQVIAASFGVQQACTLNTPSALNFSGTAPAAQPLSIALAGACNNAATWKADISDGQDWMTISATSGGVSLNAAGRTDVSVKAGLPSGTYHGSITVSATDSVTHAPITPVRKVAVTLIVPPACTLQGASKENLVFSAEVGTNPAVPQNFSIGVSGACSNATIQASASTTTGGNWLAISPVTPIAASPDQPVAFTVAVNPATLQVGTYTGTITLTATDRNTTIAGSPQGVRVTLNVAAAPALSATPASITMNVTSGQSSQPIVMQNTGGMPLDWTATLENGTPSFITVSSASGKNLAGGDKATITVNVDASAAGVTAGKTYTTKVTVNAVDPLTHKVVAGSPVSVPVTVIVAAPNMQLSANRVSFSAIQGSSPDPQSITITNSGGGSLNWHASVPTQRWLSLAPASGQNSGGSKSTLILRVNTTGLSPGVYSERITITPSYSRAAMVTVHLMITTSQVTPTPSSTTTPAVTPTSQSPVTPPPPTPTTQPTPTAQPTPTTQPTPTAQPTPAH
ncbi:MAG: choice-of-anchor D domain-containing protein [Ktedonobacteraceae bacterium]|nr:choice-of-anchor D domain-containing protein [Ktedonobacteraceae bacterium]